MDTEEKEITPMYIAESAIGPSNNKAIRDVLVAALALGIESYKDLCVEDACKKQREICANDARTTSTSIIVDKDSIRNAPMPTEDDVPISKLLLRELDELLEYGFKKFDAEGKYEEEFVKTIDGNRWGVCIEKVSGETLVAYPTHKVIITKNLRAVRYCETMEALTEKLTEYNLLK